MYESSITYMRITEGIDCIKDLFYEGVHILSGNAL